MRYDFDYIIFFICATIVLVTLTINIRACEVANINQKVNACKEVKGYYRSSGDCVKYPVIDYPQLENKEIVK